MGMKLFSISLNSLAMLLAGYFFVIYNSLLAIIVCVYLILTLVVLTRLAGLLFSRVMLFVSICVACVDTVLLAVLLVRGLQTEYELSLSTVLSLLLMLLAVVTVNLLQLVRIVRQ